MRATRLEFEQECIRRKQENDPGLEAVVREELNRTFSTRGWQLVLSLMRQIVNDALGAIGQDDQPQFHAGEIHAVERIRDKLREFYSIDETVIGIEEYSEELVPLEESEI